MQRRILSAATVLLLVLMVVPAVVAQTPPPAVPATGAAPAPVTQPAQPTPPSAAAPLSSDAVGVVVMLENARPATVDLSFPGPVTMTEITSDLRKITQWTGWAVSAPQFENLGGSNSAHVTVTEAPEVQSGLLNEVVWPLVAALAEHGRLGVVIMGAPMSAANLRIENRYVTLEQSGGQGVQSFQAFIKDTSFKNIDELKRAEVTDGASAPAHGRMAFAWLLVIIASLATGVAVYLYLGRQRGR